jgi:hypothetical protein
LSLWASERGQECPRHMVVELVRRFACQLAHPVAKNATRMGQPAIHRQWPLLISLTMLVTKALASPKSISVRSR